MSEISEKTEVFVFEQKSSKTGKRYRECGTPNDLVHKYFQTLVMEAHCPAHLSALPALTDHFNSVRGCQ